jgi:hypothetical protein
MTEQYRDWRGTAAELAALGADLLETFGLSEEKLNERLVRYYVAEGVLSRPERQGREAWFGYRQLLELLVARLLSKDGWPLAKIATWNRAADDQALRDLIPERQAGPGDPQGLLVAEGVAEYLSERLADAQQCPPHRIERQVLIQVPGAFSLLIAEADFRAMTPAKADHYAKLLRDLLRALPRDPASPHAR